MSNATNASLFSYVKRRPKRETLDSLYSNERDDITIEIDPEEQERRLKEAQDNCISKILNQTLSNANTSSDRCDIRWDSILCWPSVQVNRTVQLPCPFYINKFNRKNKAIKHCTFNPNTSLPEWSRTNFSLCLIPSEHFKEDLFETSIFEKHMKYINTICISGYTISLLSLTFSIILLLRPKLRCPRNFVHINLFLAFGLRTVLVMLVELLRNGTHLFDMNLDLANQTHNQTEDDEEKVHIPCRLIISIFRYSGSVYHASIFSEAIYLMLLLKFPYYSEKKGSKFCILTSWTLPLIWMVPWILIRMFLENKWCWQTESEWNLVIDVPHTLLLIVNIICTIFIIKILYSKIQNRNMTKEKILKYRRLAKSILILIPIFGLHFIFFAWLPYAYHITQNHSLLEIPMFYIESFFNAFQGFVASIACCFIHREVRVECLLYTCNLLKKVKLLNLFNCIKCLNMDYVNEMRFQTYDKGRVSVIRNNNEIQSNVKNLQHLSGKDTTITLDTIGSTQDNRHNSIRSTNNQRNIFYKICCCLSSNHKNDFYANNKRKSSGYNGQRCSSRFGFKKLRSQSKSGSFFPNSFFNSDKKSMNDLIFLDENIKLNSSNNENSRVKFILKDNDSSIVDIETRKSSINQTSEHEVLFEPNTTSNNDSFYSNKDQQKSSENIFEMETYIDEKSNV